MTQQKIIIIFGALVLILATGFIAVWLSLQKNTGDTGAQIEEVSYFDFLGFGAVDDQTPSNEIVGEPSDETEAVVDGDPKVKLRKLTQAPVAAAVATTTKDGLVIRYMERSNGNIFDADPITGTQTRISQRTIPRIQEAFWLSGGGHVVTRFFDAEYKFAETFIGGLVVAQPAEAGAPPQTIDGEFLDTDIESISASPTEKKVAYVRSTSTGSGVYTTKSDGTNKTQIYSSPIREWNVQWFASNTLALTTKASSAAPGFIYFLPIKGGQPERIFPGTYGLTTLVSPTGERILYGEATEEGYIFSNYNRKDKSTNTLPITTIPDKCVWSKTNPTLAYCGVPRSMSGNDYPDTWYMGITSFTDEIWQIDTVSGAATLMAMPKEYTSEEIDAIQLDLTKSEDQLFFTNKKDGALWILDLDVIDTI